MNKTSIIAILSSIAILFLVYIFTDIKQDNKTNKPSTSSPIGKSENNFIDNFNKSLATSAKEKVHNFYIDAVEHRNVAATDSLILFYEQQQQYNIAAYYHSLKAEILNTSDAWEVAGDRQLSVSSNTAFNADFNLELLQNAIKAYENALNLDENNLEIKVKLGSALVGNSEQPMQGITYLLEVIQEDSMHLNANFALGKFGIISGQYDKAIIRLEKVLALQPENTEALFLSAEAYDNLGRTDEAIASLQKTKELVQNQELKNEIDAYLQQLILK